MVIRDLEQFTPRLDSIKGDMPRAVIGEKYSVIELGWQPVESRNALLIE
jgi:hypothetical protein